MNEIKTQVGYKVKLKVPCLGNKIGNIGYVYEQYQDFDDPKLFGVSVIFENGQYCGFSAKEKEMFLESVMYKYTYSYYEFENVSKLIKDYNHGFWNFD